MNMQAMMQQAQKLQRDIMKKKEEIDQQLFPGKYEWVEVVFNGKKEIQSIKITNSELKADDLEMLEDMILLAIKDSMKKIDEETEKKMGQYSSLTGLM